MKFQQMIQGKKLDTPVSFLYFFYVGDLCLLRGTEMKQHNLGFLTIISYSIKTFEIFLSY